MTAYPDENAKFIGIISWHSKTWISGQIRNAKQQDYLNIRELSRKKETGSAAGKTEKKGLKRDDGVSINIFL